MMDNSKPKSYATVFIKILDKGFNLSVPAEHEVYYREGYEVFLHKIKIHQEKGYSPLEAISLTSIDCLVALQKAQDQLNKLIAALEDRVDDLDSTVSEAL
ncbi:cell division protein ZapA [Arundinibacter roseus]|uniref:Cell division protein ZapA n=1 Tax=Arundinibacter roseus TaxID=2070510 RepID=A0A4R4KC51_9BACT|nr:cell division protein ZapA [Arundinibacter roseus]TDB65223.1 cell division protein ZapA [Arundinibacter roseus]